jgi:hypothetical protein
VAEDRTREAYDGQDITEEHSFDQLARGLASGSVSRKQALKVLGGALLGGVLASIPGVALAQNAGGNSACDEFCHTVFGGQEAGLCTSAAARGGGPCFECTPGVGPGPNFTPPECAAGEEFNEDTCQCEATTVPCPGRAAGPCPAGATCCSPPSRPDNAICCAPGTTCCTGTGEFSFAATCCAPLVPVCGHGPTGSPVCRPPGG